MNHKNIENQDHIKTKTHGSNEDKLFDTIEGAIVESNLFENGGSIVENDRTTY